MERKYVAFISYRHAELDSAVAKQLHTLIEQFTIPRALRKNGQKKLGLVFRDQEELPISSNLSDDICKALDNSQFLIVVCSKSTAASPWVGREIEYFLSHHDQQHTLAALASGEPVDVFPKPITYRYNAQGEREEVEPLAIDIRSDSIPGMKKLLKREILRLCAALIGCPYDALVMRQQRRKRRQLAGIMGLILAVVTSFAAVTLAKNFQIDQKNQELAGMNLTLEGMNQTLEGKNLELENKNDELARQKAEVQLRESELLTEKGMAAVAENDTQEALENFLAALPSQQEERPYYALAEQGLTSALEVYREDRENYKAFSTVLEQNTPVVDYCINADGTRLLTLDQYSLLTCFDIATAQVLWTGLVNADVYADHQQMLTDTQRDCVYVQSGAKIVAVDWQTGAYLWTHDAGLSYNMYRSPDNNILVYRREAFANNYASYQHYYVFLSAETGEELLQVDLGTCDTSYSSDNPEPHWQFPDVFDVDCRNGAFSSDSKQFAFSYVEESDDEKYRQKYLVIDLQTGTCQTVAEYKSTKEESYNKIHQLYFIDGDQALLVARRDISNYVTVLTERIDLSTGKRVWETAMEGNPQNYTGSSRKMYGLVGSNVAYFARGEYLHVVDLTTGEYICSYVAATPIVSLEWAEPSGFSIITAGGEYTLGWATRSAGILLTANRMDTRVYLGGISAAKEWNQGGLRFLYDDTQLLGADGGGAEKGYGFVAVIPEENGNAVQIKRVAEFGNLFPLEQLDTLEDSEYLIEGHTFYMGQDRLILGRSSQSLDGGQIYRYYEIDLNTQQTQRIAQQEYISSQYLWFVPQTRQLLTAVSGEDMYLTDVDTGELTTLLENETLNSPGNHLPHDKYLYDSAYQTKDQSLYTVAASRDQLTLWRNGQLQKQVQIPEEYCVQTFAIGSHYRTLQMGSNGVVLMSRYSQFEEGQIQGFVAYDTGTDKWYSFGQTLELTDAEVALCQESLWAVVNDGSNHVSVCDMTTGAVQAQFSLGLPQNSVSQLMPVLEDRYLLVKTDDGQLYFYELLTGQVVFRCQMDGSARGNLHLAVDEDQQRLYIWDDYSGEATGLCLDLDSWTELARIPGLRYYDAARDQVYLYWHYKLHVMHAPTLEEMIAVGNGLLNP